MTFKQRIHLKRHISRWNTENPKELRRQLKELEDAMNAGFAATQLEVGGPLTTKGDIYTRNSSKDTRLPIGTFRQRLQPTAEDNPSLEWANDADGFELIAGAMPNLYAHADDYDGSARWRTRVGPDLVAEGSPTAGTGWDGLQTVNLDGSGSFFRADSLSTAHVGDLKLPFVAIMALDMEENAANQALFGWGDSDTSNTWKTVYSDSTQDLTWRNENDAGSAATITAAQAHPTGTFIVGVVHDGTDLFVWSLSASGFFEEVPPTADAVTGAGLNVDNFTLGINDRSSDTNDAEMKVRMFLLWNNHSVSEDGINALLEHATRRGAHVGGLAYNNTQGYINYSSGSWTWGETGSTPDQVDVTTVLDATNSVDMTMPANCTIRNGGVDGYFDIWARVIVDVVAVNQRDGIVMWLYVDGTEASDTEADFSADDIAAGDDVTIRTTLCLRSNGPVLVSNGEDVTLWGTDYDSSAAVSVEKVWMGARRVRNA